MKNLFKKNNGQSLVEFALVLPILILLVLGIAEFGRLFEAYLELENAARDGARYASVNSLNFDSATATTWGTTNVRPRLVSDLVMVDPNDVTISLQKSASSDVTLTLSYDLALMTPIIGDIIATNPDNSITLTSKITMRGE